MPHLVAQKKYGLKRHFSRFVGLCETLSVLVDYLPLYPFHHQPHRHPMHLVTRLPVCDLARNFGRSTLHKW